MACPIGEDFFAPEVTADPYVYFRRLRDEDPVHWNDRYETWVITRYDDVVWMLRHPEMFSSAWWQKDLREPYPAIEKSDVSLWQSVRNHQADTFSQHDPRSIWRCGEFSRARNFSTPRRTRARWTSSGTSQPLCQYWSFRRCSESRNRFALEFSP